MTAPKYAAGQLVTLRVYPQAPGTQSLDGQQCRSDYGQVLEPLPTVVTSWPALAGTIGSYAPPAMPAPYIVGPDGNPATRLLKLYWDWSTSTMRTLAITSDYIYLVRRWDAQTRTSFVGLSAESEMYFPDGVYDNPLITPPGALTLNVQNGLGAGPTVFAHQFDNTSSELADLAATVRVDGSH